jgi:uncharacterized protein (TIGR00106 family)
MLAEFSMYPMDSTHMSKEVAKVVEKLEESGLSYHLGPMSTAVEGSWKQVLEAIYHCHQVVAREHDRVITTITIDDRKGDQHHLNEMVARVEEELGHPVAKG